MPEAVDRPISLAFPSLDQPKLDAYLELLGSWSRIHNLTGGKSSAEHAQLVMDCEPLVAAAARTTGPICDIGSGAGMPGIMLALAEPRRPVTLLDSEASKCAFLEQARILLELDNVTVVHSRSESWFPEKRPGVICCRAVASLASLASQCEALIGPGVRLLALKSRNPQAEIDELLAVGGWKLLDLLVSESSPSRYLVSMEAGA